MLRRGSPLADLPPLPAGYTLQQAPPAASGASPGALPPLPAGYTLQATPPVKPPQTPQEPSKSEAPRTFADLFKSGAKAWGEAIAGPVEAGLSAVTGAVAKPVADVAGLAATGVDLARGNKEGDPAGFQQEVQQDLTYQPRTDLGKATTGVIGAVGEATVGAAAHGAKDYYGGAARMLGLPDAVAEGIGNAAEEVTKQAPNVMGARVAGEVGAARAGAKAAATPAGDAAAAAKAESHVRNRLGMDWNQLPQALQSELTRIAKSGGNLENLSKAAIERRAALQGLRIPVETTRAKLTRDAADLRREAVASKTDAGAPIRETDARANRDIQANLEVLRGRKAGLRGGLHDPTEEGAPQSPSVRAPTKSAEDVGASLQGQVRAKAAASKANYNALYKKARETEPNAAVSVEPLHEMLEKNPEIQHLGFMQGWLKKAGTREVDDAGNVNSRPVTLHELHDLREKAGGIARAGGTDGYYAGQVVRAIDEAMKEVPAGAEAWQAANKAFREHQKEFKDQAIIAKLVSSKGGDRALAVEKTANTIAKGSIDQIRQVKKTLLTQPTGKARFEGRQAWKDLQGETVNRILEDARNVVATDETERSVLTAAALRKGINSVGRDRLTEIIGKNSTDELYRILRAAKITRTEPAGRVTESGTVPNALVLAEKGLAHLIPGGKYIRGAKDAIKTLGERGQAARDTEAAIKSPLQVAAEESEARAAARNASRRRQLTTLGAASAIAPRGNAPP